MQDPKHDRNCSAKTRSILILKIIFKTVMGLQSPLLHDHHHQSKSSQSEKANLTDRGQAKIHQTGKQTGVQAGRIRQAESKKAEKVVGCKLENLAE